MCGGNGDLILLKYKPSKTSLDGDMVAQQLSVREQYTWGKVY